MPVTLKVKRRFTPAPALLALLAIAFAGLAVAQQPAPEVPPVEPTLPARVLTPIPEPRVILEDLAGATARNTVVEVILSAQRLTVHVDGKLAVESPVTTGRKSAATPEGEFVVMGRTETVDAGDYGNFVDRNGNVLVAGVYRILDGAPRGTRFVPVPRKYALGVEGGKTRFVAGHVRSTPSTDGSIVVPESVAWVLFEKIPDGAAVRVLNESPAADAADDPAPSAPPAP